MGRPQELIQDFANTRETVGNTIDNSLHCHWKFNSFGAIAMSNTVKPLNVTFIEDPLNVSYSDCWVALKRGTGVPVLTGENSRRYGSSNPSSMNRQ